MTAKPKPIAEPFGVRLRRMRLAAGLSQEAAAARAGIKQSYWSAIERGARGGSVAMLRKLAAGIGCTAGELLGEE